MHWVAWAAGVVDGEGSIAFHAKGGYPSLSVSQVDRRMLDRLEAMFGGSTCLCVRRSAIPRRRPIYQWCVTGQGALDALNQLRPYLVVKGEQADCVLSYVMTGRGRKRTDEQLAQGRAINARLKELRAP